MKEQYQEFKSANVTTKLRKLQSIEDRLIEDKLGSECLLFTEWMHNTHELLGTQPPKNAQYEALKANENLQNKAYKILIASFVVMLVLAIIINRDIDELSESFQKNLIILFFIFLTEYAFLTYVGQNFLSADPDVTKNIVFKKIKELITRKA